MFKIETLTVGHD